MPVFTGIFILVILDIFSTLILGTVLNLFKLSMFNDLKAPRFNPRKYRENILSKELYISWKAKTGRTESFSEFKAVWNKLAETIIETVIEERDGVRLPKGMGDKYLGYVPSTKKEFIDYQASAEHGKPIRHENWNSSGKPGKIIYGTRHRRYVHKLGGWWAFNPCRKFTRLASKAFRDNPERYKNSIEKRK